ncbi:MAG: hypothetical protein MHM6MM_002095 [Cercozoa sp. M6MM]
MQSALISRVARRCGAASMRMASSTAQFEMTEALGHKMPEQFMPPSTTSATREELLQYYKDMFRVRRMELACDALYKQKAIRGFCHLYDGQEAVVVGMEAALKPEDHVITAYRCHGNQLLRAEGDSMRAIMAEMLGKEGGSSGGKGGSMHLYLPSQRFYGGNGIVGAQIAVGAGVAYANKYHNRDEVCVALMGDGAANQGQVFESLNMAALWKLPAIFVVENNKYAMGTSINRGTASGEFYKRGDYVPGIRVDGLDALAVREGFRAAREYALKEGPIMVEVMTYRYHGHSMSDPGISYRTRDEVEDVRKTKDCIAKVKAQLLDNGLATQDELKQIEKEAKAEVKDAVDYAKSQPLPADKEVFTDVYVENLEPFTRGPDLSQSIGHYDGLVVPTTPPQ